MSKLLATVTRVQSLESLNLVSFDLFGVTLKMMSLDIDAAIKIGTKVSLNIKPVSVAIAKNLSGELSYSNKIDSRIKSINNGEILCSLELSFADIVFESIITAESAYKMNLKIGDEVTALIKANDISISEVLS